MAAADPIPIYVFAGQSNMVGSHAKAAELPAHDPTLSVPQSNALFWGPTADAPREWVPLEAPTEIWQSAVRSGFGPEISAGKRLTKLNGGRQIAIFKYARNATNLSSHWDPSNSAGLYPQMITRLRIAMNALSKKVKRPVRIAGFFWMQGESDAASKVKAYGYGRNLRELIGHVRKDTKQPYLPFVIGQIMDVRKWYGLYPHSDMVRWKQYEVARADPNAYLVRTDGLTQDRLSKAHFDTKGTVNLGYRMVQSGYGL